MSTGSGACAAMAVDQLAAGPARSGCRSAGRAGEDRAAPARRRVRKSSARGGDRVLHGRRRQRRARHLGVEIVLADQDAAAGVGQDLDQLPLAQHRVARHDHRAALPRREHRDQHLRDVLQVHRHAIARLDAAPLQRHGQRVRHHVALAGRDRLVEVVHQRRRRGRGAPWRGTCRGRSRLAGSIVDGTASIQAEPADDGRDPSWEARLW